LRWAARVFYAVLDCTALVCTVAVVYTTVLFWAVLLLFPAVLCCDVSWFTVLQHADIVSGGRACGWSLSESGSAADGDTVNIGSGHRTLLAPLICVLTLSPLRVLALPCCCCNRTSTVRRCVRRRTLLAGMAGHASTGWAADHAAGSEYWASQPPWLHSCGVAADMPHGLWVVCCTARCDAAHSMRCNMSGSIANHAMRTTSLGCLRRGAARCSASCIL
jgi:hypothetical protein